LGKDWVEGGAVARVPIVVTANDLSTVYAPLLRDGRMDKFYWEPTHEELTQVRGRCWLSLPPSLPSFSFPPSHICLYNAFLSLFLEHMNNSIAFSESLLSVAMWDPSK
jgi:hypothetical protein